MWFCCSQASEGSYFVGFHTRESQDQGKASYGADFHSCRISFAIDWLIIANSELVNSVYSLLVTLVKESSILKLNYANDPMLLPSLSWPLQVLLGPSPSGSCISQGIVLAHCCGKPETLQLHCTYLKDWRTALSCENDTHSLITASGGKLATRHDSCDMKDICCMTRSGWCHVLGMKRQQPAPYLLACCRSTTRTLWSGIMESAATRSSKPCAVPATLKYQPQTWTPHSRYGEAYQELCSCTRPIPGVMLI